MRYLFLVITTALAVAVCWALNTKLGAVPPMGKLLNPADGFWQNCEGKTYVPGLENSLEGLTAPVKVVYDERRVPHIFAENEADLYFMQGYVTACDRLWQMEFQVMAAAGRLSEIIDNPRVVEIDRLARRKGMVFAAEKAAELMEKDPITNVMIGSLTKGINARINNISTADLPVEYKLMNYRPEPWTTLKSALLLKKMAENLTGRTVDMQNTNTHHILGDSLYREVMALFPDTADAIIPQGTPWNFSDTLYTQAPDSFNPEGVLPNLFYQNPPEMIGSNNWAVHGSKTKSGKPILCNDPHLALSFPSIWYEMQLSAPGVNVYGVTLPGAPGVIIGFNEKVSWGVTNGSRDVLDWYHIKFKDASRAEYWHDNQWKKTTQKIEEIKIVGKPSLMDTVIYTHHGPVTYDRSFGVDGWPMNIAMHWEAHQPSNEALTFHYLNRAANHADYRKALVHFHCPGQNFVFAASDGDIAITQQGRFPVKWQGQGEFIMDGTNPEHEWTKYIPADQNPTVRNPERGFVSSANQHPTTRDYPYTVHGLYEFYRNRRINSQLESMNQVTIQDMEKLQNDNYNLKAAEVIPLFMQYVQTEKLSERAREWVGKVAAWDKMNETAPKEPAFWDEWFAAVYWGILEDELGNSEYPANTPPAYTLAKIMREQPAHPLVDDITTPEVETLPEIITNGAEEALVALDAWSEEHEGQDWTWQNYNNVNVLHLARLAPFSRDRLPTGGNAGIVNAARKNWAPSWRMIVEMGDKPTARGVFPGGASGNPGSQFYATGVDPWAAGQYFDLHLYPNAEAAAENVLTTHAFEPAGK